MSKLDVTATEFELQALFNHIDVNGNQTLQTREIKEFMVDKREKSEGQMKDEIMKDTAKMLKRDRKSYSQIEDAFSKWGRNTFLTKRDFKAVLVSDLRLEFFKDIDILFVASFYPRGSRADEVNVKEFLNDL